MPGAVSCAVPGGKAEYIMYVFGAASIARYVKNAICVIIDRNKIKNTSIIYLFPHIFAAVLTFKHENMCLFDLSYNNIPLCVKVNKPEHKASFCCVMLTGVGGG
jgi:hypothetical protein